MIALAVAGESLAMAVPPSWALEGATGIVKERMDLMTQMGKAIEGDIRAPARQSRP